MNIISKMTTQKPEEIITFQINPEYSVDIKKYIGSYGEYYNVNNTNYDIHFPIEWVFQRPLNEHELETPSFGPDECNLCAEYGYYRGVFIGYCIHCAKYAKYTRGNGMLHSGIEMDQKQADELGIPIKYKEKNSMWNVYMQTAELSKIGDEELMMKHISFFHTRKKINSDEIERVFDFYSWLNSSLDLQFYTSDDDLPDLHSVSSVDDLESESKYKLSLVLPEPESEN